MKKIILLLTAFTFLTIKNIAQTVTDYDGNVYNTVAIGSQTWMKENLRVIHYSNGGLIPNITDNSTWVNLMMGAMSWYNNDSATYSLTYGALYNWYAVNDTNLCPVNWHLPDDSDWTQLFFNLGNDLAISGGKLKEIGTTHWLPPNTGATDESKFSALPGGYRSKVNGTFINLGTLGCWWSSSESIGNVARLVLQNTSTNIDFQFDSGIYGLSVRCIKNNNMSIEYTNPLRQINIYPNPAIDKINIDYIERQNSNLYVYNLVGELLLQKELTKNKNEIDISFLGQGLYLIKIFSANKIFQCKLIKK